MNVQETWMLLQIADLAKQWPNLKVIHDLAMAELEDMVVEAKDELDKRAEAKAKTAADAQAKIDATAKTAADKEAKASEAAKPRAVPAPTLADTARRDA